MTEIVRLRRALPPMPSLPLSSLTIDAARVEESEGGAESSGRCEKSLDTCATGLPLPSPSSPSVPTHATTSILGFAWQALKTILPMRPKPLMPTLTLTASTAACGSQEGAGGKQEASRDMDPRTELAVQMLELANFPCGVRAEASRQEKPAHGRQLAADVPLPAGHCLHCTQALHEGLAIPV